MIRYLIKNNLKLMLRNKWTIAVMILGPVFVTALLSSAFEDLMASYEATEEFQVGYRMEEESNLKDSIEVIKEAGKESGISFVEYPGGKIKELMEHNDLAGFVEIGRESYTVYESADYVTEGITLEYFLNRCMKEGTWQALKETIPSLEEENTALPVQKIDYLSAVEAKDYYGIIEIVYFCWMCVVCLSNVLTGEKKNGIERKYQVTNLSGIKLYFSKWIPIVIATTAEMAVSVTVTIVLFDIHWGNLLPSAGILLLLIMASAAFGLMLYYLFKNLAVTVIVLFTAVWFMGFFGGSFETYMFSSTPDVLKNSSPIYHVNRTLVEYSCMGHSGYTNSCIFYMLAMILICSCIAILVDGVRKRGRA